MTKATDPGWRKRERATQKRDAPTAPPNRQGLLTVLTVMPDEAFGWFVVWASGGMMQYPDGLGGFMPASRDSILALRKAAREYLE